MQYDVPGSKFTPIRIVTAVIADCSVYIISVLVS